MSDSIPLRILDLRVSLRNGRALPYLSLDLHAGEFISLMGENGAGKTTLLEAILGYRKQLSGEVLFWGKSLKESNSRQLFAKTAFVSSRPEVYPPGAIVSDLLRSLEFLYPTWNRDLAGTLLEGFKIKQSQPLNEMSLGESTKVRLLKALAFEPELLLLDELTANLSPESKSSVTSSLIDLFSRKRMAVLYVCHSPAEATHLSDRILVLDSKGLNERLS